ncbi:MAG: MATE family efflux transporter [Acidimicrobiia bacterium]|nr:MAG: MATE family efflux transporter [Acidimicrobiia bacterium]
MAGTSGTGLTVSNRRILRLAVPALGALAADPLLSLIDTAFVGRLGAVPLAALGVDVALFSLAFALFNFLAYATTPLVASARARGDVSGSGKVILQSATLAVVIGVSSGFVLAVFAPTLVGWMQASGEVVEPAVEYLRVRALAVPALLIVTVGHGAYRGLQDTRTPLIVTLAVNGLNAILDPLLIFGAGLGIAGAAWATVSAQWIGAAVFVRLLAGRARLERWPRSPGRPTEMVPLLKEGGVLVARTLFLLLSLTAATAAAARVGTVPVAAHQVVAQVWFLLAMVVDALAIAAQALVADLAGRGAWAAARSLVARLIRWGLATGAVLGLLVWLAADQLGPLFTSDPAVTAAVASVAPIAAAMQPAAAVLFVLDGVFLGLMRTRWLAVSTAVGLVATLAVLFLTLWAGWGLRGVWWAVTSMVMGRLLVLSWAYRSGWTASSA